MLTPPPAPCTLVARHDAAVPRYTSYPALPDWSGGVTPATWRARLATLHERAAPMDLYVHLPFCRSTCHYCGCNATVTTRREVVDRYLERLEREAGMVAAAIGTPPRVAALHLGGGTPNFLADDQLADLHAMLTRHFPFDARTEQSVEADPRLVTPAQLARLVDLGFTRVSFGVQDLDAEVQRAIGRVQPVAMVASVVEEARAAGFRSVNVDLIYGLPRQTAATFAETIAMVSALAPDRIACFGYAHVPWMKSNQKQIRVLDLPGRDDRFALFELAVERFTAAGYRWIGLDHFAHPDDALARAAEAGTLHRNFMGYTLRPGEDLVGLGNSAISEVGGWFAQSAPKLGDWQRAVDAGELPVVRGHVSSEDDRRRGVAIERLMCNAELPYDAWDGGEDDLGQRLLRFAMDGMVAFEGDRVRVTRSGRFFLRTIGAALDAYREAPRPDAPRFSRAV